MDKLVRRYVTQRQKLSLHRTISTDDINELKQDISALRHELLALFRSNGFKVSSAKFKSGLLPNITNTLLILSNLH